MKTSIEPTFENCSQALRAGGGASANAANKYAKEAAALTKELDFARSQLAQSEFRFD